MPAKAKPLRFMATIYKIWLMRHVDVPDEIAKALAKQVTRGSAAGLGAKGGDHKHAKYIPVVASVNGKSTRTTLVPAGGGRYRMQINTAQREAAKVDAGDVVSVELRVDQESRELAVPRDLQIGLKLHPKARQAFKKLPPGHKRQLILWFDAAKSEAAREKRLARAIDHLLERAMLRRSKT